MMNPLKFFQFDFIRISRRQGRGRGFTLIETLMGLMILAVVGMILIAGQRWLTLITNRSSRWLLARDRGQRVISFLDARVLHAGLGLSACREEGALQRALGKGIGDAPVPSQWAGDIFIRVYVEKPIWPTPAKEQAGVFRGTGLSIIYARPSGLVLKTLDGKSTTLYPGKSMEFNVLLGTVGNAGFLSGQSQDIRSWGVLPLVGMPFYLSSAVGRNLSLSLPASATTDAEIPPINELFLLRCERFRVLNGDFCYQTMETHWFPPNFYPREDGILAMWVEWSPKDKTLDLWVLATGGAAVFAPSARPATWPADAPWRDEFGRHELCVSRASWKLENL